MKQIFKIVSVSVTILLIILASCSVAFASVPTWHFSFSIQKPTVTNLSGYMEALFENVDYGYFACNVYQWYFTPSSSSNEAVGSTELNINLDYVNNKLRFTFRTDPGVNGFLSFLTVNSNGSHSYNTLFVDVNSVTLECPAPSGCVLNNTHYYGSYESFGSLNSYRGAEFFVTYSESSVISSDLVNILNKLNYISELLGNSDYSSQLYDILDELYELNFTLENSDATLSEIKQNLTTKLMQLYNIGQTILGELEKITSNTDQLDAWLEEINLRLGTLYSGIDELSDWLDSINIQLIELKGFLYEMWLVDLDSNSKLYEIFDTLNAILSNLEAYSDVKFPEHNGSNVDELVSKEHGLLDNSEVDVSDALDVQVNPEAMTSVLGMVERVFNLHPKIIGLIVTILGLGLIALILGR